MSITKCIVRQTGKLMDRMVEKLERQNQEYDGRVKTETHCQLWHGKTTKTGNNLLPLQLLKQVVWCALCVYLQNKQTLNICTYTILNSFLYSIQMNILKLLRLLCSVASLPVPETTLVRLTVRYSGILGAAVELKSTVDITSATK